VACLGKITLSGIHVAFVTFNPSKLQKQILLASLTGNPHQDDVMVLKVSISLVCVSISILGEINQATLDSTLAPVVLNSAYPFLSTQSLPEGFATLNDMSILEDSNWFYQPRLGNLERKKGLSLSPHLFGTQ
jgi:hypothetical protein